MRNTMTVSEEPAPQAILNSDRLHPHASDGGNGNIYSAGGFTEGNFPPISPDSVWQDGSASRVSGRKISFRQ